MRTKILYHIILQLARSLYEKYGSCPVGALGRKP